MRLIDTPPKNELEEAFINGRNGTLSVKQVIELLMKEKLLFPSTNKCKLNGIGLEPLIFDRDGVQMAALFTSEERMNYYHKQINDSIVVPFREVVTKGIPEYGLVINPGFTVGLELLPNGLDNIRRDFIER